MQQINWSRYLMAAALVLIVGAVWALAEETEMRVEVRNEHGKEITIEVDGEREVITLDDLAEGESLEYEVGGRLFTVRRIDHVLLLDDLEAGGQTLFVGEAGSGDTTRLWVADDGDEAAHERRVIIMKSDEDDDFDIDFDLLHERLAGHRMLFLGDESGEGREVIVITGEPGDIDVDALKDRYGDDAVAVIDGRFPGAFRWRMHSGDHPRRMRVTNHRRGGGYAHYRCDESGSMLTVKSTDDLLDSYVDPATGCVMQRVDAGADVRVISADEERVIVVE